MSQIDISARHKYSVVLLFCFVFRCLHSGWSVMISERTCSEQHHIAITRTLHVYIQGGPKKSKPLSIIIIESY